MNLLGEIECDASIMDGKSLNFGAVGALSGMLPVYYSTNYRFKCKDQFCSSFVTFLERGGIINTALLK